MGSKSKILIILFFSFLTFQFFSCNSGTEQTVEELNEEEVTEVETEITPEPQEVLETETQDDIDYRTAKSRGTIEAYENYLRNYPDGRHSAEAQQFITQISAVRDSIETAQNEQQAYQIAKKENTVAAYEFYLNKYPDGKYRQVSEKKLQELKAELEAAAQKEADNKAFRIAKSQNTLEAYGSYLEQYPDGLHISEVRNQVRILEQKEQQRIANEDEVFRRTEIRGTIEAYEAYLKEYPNGKYVQQSRQVLEMLYEDKQYQDKAPPNMVYVRGGSFKMGSNRGKGDESPIHEVTVNSFYIHKYEVTNAQFALFLNAYGSDVVKDGDNSGQDMIFEEEWGLRYDGTSWTPQPGYAAHPVINVTWFGAVEFCNFYGYRLPTEAEWEYAARGGIRSREYRYSGSSAIDTVAWYSDNSRTTRPVGKKQYNELGIYDMSGNVWEWCADWYDKNYYSRSPRSNPQGPSSSNAKVLRGGSFFDDRGKCNVSTRDFSFPFIGYYSYGFRCVKDIN